jgi:hypothetical protein
VPVAVVNVLKTSDKSVDELARFVNLVSSPSVMLGELLCGLPSQESSPPRGKVPVILIGTPGMAVSRVEYSAVGENEVEGDWCPRCCEVRA